MKNYKQIKANIKKHFDKQRKDAKTSARVWVGRECIDNPTKEQRKRALKQLDKEQAREFAKLERIANAKQLDSITIVTEWKRNPTWGNNPHSSASLYYIEGGADSFYGRASGCGYDKYSAAVTEALSASDSVRRLLCENYRKLKKEFSPENGCYVYLKGGIPSLATSGSGISSLKRVFLVCGIKCEEDRSGKHSDYLHFYRH